MLGKSTTHFESNLNSTYWFVMSTENGSEISDISRCRMPGQQTNHDRTETVGFQVSGLTVTHGAWPRHSGKKYQACFSLGFAVHAGYGHEFPASPLVSAATWHPGPAARLSAGARGLRADSRLLSQCFERSFCLKKDCRVFTQLFGRNSRHICLLDSCGTRGAAGSP